MDLGGYGEISGILEKRRQNLKFHWRTYQFTLKGMKLSYFKMRGSDDKEGELWGTIDIRTVQSLVSVPLVGSRYPMEMTLRSGKVILLGAGSSEERIRWLQAIQETMASVRRSHRSSDTPVIWEKPLELSQGVCDWTSKSNPGSEAGSPVSNEDTDELTDLDSFIDQTFNGITFNRQSQLIKTSTRMSQPAESNSYNT